MITLPNEKIISIAGLSETSALIGTDYRIYKVDQLNSQNPTFTNITGSTANIASPAIRKVNNDIIVVTPNQIYKYYPKGDSIGIHPDYIKQSNYKAFCSNPEQTWLRLGLQWTNYPQNETNNRIAKYLGLFDRVNYVNYVDSNEVWVINGYNQIYKLSPTKANDTLSNVNLYVRQVLDKSGNNLNTDYVRLESTNNAFKIKLGAPFYLKEKAVEYQYKLEGVMPEWSDWGNTPEKDFPFFPPGNHVLKFRVRDAMGNISKTHEYPFSITPPFYQTIWFYLLIVAFAITTIVLLIQIRERKLQREKQVLEQKVKERTKTIEEQKDALEVQRDEIITQRDQIVSQNQDIIKSISYARRIQTAVMPSKEIADNILKDYFILLKPRDIVSGDFFWMAQKNGKIIVTAADCTGHGVPGAFMSLLGITLLTEIVKNIEDIHPHIILNKLRVNIKRTLSQAGREHEAKDGMDIALSIIDTQTNKLSFAGAYNPLYLVRNSELTEYKGDKMPVGIHINEKESFTLHEIPLQKGDCIYMFSDGYIDQFGGADNRKFMSKNFKQLLVDVSTKGMEEQKIILDDTIDQWIGPHDQLDDILVMGIRI
ncbi:MAG: PP2C family protein-serine/threonine phosphatase [Bacteroidales bacterium]